MADKLNSGPIQQEMIWDMMHWDTPDSCQDNWKVFGCNCYLDKGLTKVNNHL